MLVATAWTRAGDAARSVEGLLTELRRSGVDVIYSSELVTPALLASTADASLPPLQGALDAFERQGLTLRRLGPKTYVVVRMQGGPASATSQDATENLQEISVYASRYSVDAASLTEPLRVTAADIEAVPGSHDDALRSLRVLPGLASNASARPYIRGSLSEDVLVRYDGITLLDPFHFKNFQSLLSAIDPSTIDSIEVFSGGFPVRYGTRSGGVIDMTAPTIRSGADHRAAVSLMSAGLSTIGQSESWPLEWLGSMRRSTLDLLQPLVDEFGRPQFADTLGRLRLRTAQGAWTVGWLLLDDRLRLGVEGDAEQARARYRDEYVWLARDHRFSDAVTTRATLVAASADRSRSGVLDSPGVGTGIVDENRRFNGVELTNDWVLAPDDRSTYTFGGSIGTTRAVSRFSRHQQFSPLIAAAFARPESEALDFQINPSVYTAALHVAQRQRWADFEAELGVRLDAQRFDPGGGQMQFSPRLNLRYDKSRHTRFYASVGRFTQAQHVEAWRIEEAQQTADPAQVAIHSILGFEHVTTSALRLGIEAYSKRWTSAAPYFDHNLDPLSLLPELAPDRVRIDPTESEASGLEIRVRKPVSEHMAGFATLAWSRVADDITTGDTLRGWDQPLALTTGLSWQGSRAAVSAVLGWHRGWPRTPFRWNPGAAGAADALQLGTRNSERWGDFYSLDLRGSWTWTLFDGDLSVVLDVTNATDRENECCVRFARPPDSSRLRPDFDHWLPFLMNLGVTYRWHTQ